MKSLQGKNQTRGPRQYISPSASDGEREKKRKCWTGEKKGGRCGTPSRIRDGRCVWVRARGGGRRKERKRQRRSSAEKAGERGRVREEGSGEDGKVSPYNRLASLTYESLLCMPSSPPSSSRCSFWLALRFASSSWPSSYFLFPSPRPFNLPLAGVRHCARASNSRNMHRCIVGFRVRLLRL